MDIKDYNINTKEEDLIKACQNLEQTTATSEGKALYLDYFLGLLNLKQQKDLLEKQNEFNKELLKTNKKLVKATWALAGATVLIVVVTAVITLCA